MEDVFFIKDDLTQEKEDNIKALLNILEEKTISNEVFAAKRFMVATMYAAKTMQDKKIKTEQKRLEKERKAAMPKILRRDHVMERNPAILTQSQDNLLMPVMQEQLDSQTIHELPEPEAPEFVGSTSEESATPELTSRKEYNVILSATQVLVKAMIDFENGKLKYTIIEPNINHNIVKRTIDLLGRKLKKDPGIIKDDALMAKVVKKACKKYKTEFTSNYYENVKYYLYRDYIRFGKIDPLIMDVNIAAITCEGVNRPIIIDYSTSQKMEINIIFESNEEVNDVLFKFAMIAGVDLSTANPVLNVAVSGMRIEANLGIEEISSRFIIRKL